MNPRQIQIAEEIRALTIEMEDLDKQELTPYEEWDAEQRCTVHTFPPSARDIFTAGRESLKPLLKECQDTIEGGIAVHSPILSVIKKELER